MNDPAQAPENRMMGQPGMPGPNTGAPMAGPPGGVPAGPQGGPQGGPAQAMPSPEAMRGAIEHNDIVIKGLLELLAKPTGSLSKKQVTDTAADIIAKGGFPGPEQKQALIVNLAGLKDTDKDIRADLTNMLTQLLDFRAVLFRHLRPQGAA